MSIRKLLGALLLLMLLPHQASASQNSCIMPTTGTVSGLTLVQDMNNCFNAIASSNSGASSPTNIGPFYGMPWLNTSNNSLNVYDGAQFIPWGYVDVTNHLFNGIVGGGTSTLASSTTTDLCSVPQAYVSITGTTTITSFGSSCIPGQMKEVTFVSTPQVTYNATSMILPGARSITAQAGDHAKMVYLGSSNWVAVNWTRADGTSLASTATPVGSVQYYAGVAVPSSSWVLGYGQSISRSTYPEYASAVTSVQNGTTTLGSTTLSGLTDTSFLGVGMPIEGTNIAAGTTISSITNSTSLVMSAAASGSGTASVSIFTTGYGSGGNNTTVGVFDCRASVIAGRSNMGGSDPGILTSTYLGASPTALNALGGVQSTTLATLNLPPYTPAGSVATTTTLSPSGIASNVVWSSGAGALAIGGGAQYSVGALSVSSSSTFTGTAQGGSSTPFSRVQPTRMANCLVRVLP